MELIVHFKEVNKISKRSENNPTCYKRALFFIILTKKNYFCEKLFVTFFKGVQQENEKKIIQDLYWKLVSKLLGSYQ